MKWLMGVINFVAALFSMVAMMDAVSSSHALWAIGLGSLSVINLWMALLMVAGHLEGRG